MTTNYDLIVIGAGPGGYETAATAAGMGLRTLIVERDHPGGTCLNRGCIPTKALCHAAEAAAVLTEAGYPPPSFSEAIARKDAIVAQLREGVMMELKGVDYVSGEARFTAPDTIEACGAFYSAPKIIVASGSAPARLCVSGADTAIDSDALLSTDRLPASIVIIGGGVIGMEFASILASFGSKVTVVEYCREILPTFDNEIAKRLRMALKRRGITIITSAQVTAIKDGRRVAYTAKGKESTVEAECVMMAVGRRPVIPPGLTELGAATERGALTVDKSMQTTVKGVYAIGDVNGLCMLAHAATAQGRVALGLEQPLWPVPAAVFTRPECAMAGLTEQQCSEADMDFTVGTATFRANGKAVAMGATDGMVKVIVERTTLRILGCHICGEHASDLIAEPSLAIAAGLDAATMMKSIHTHPTLSETIHSAISNALQQ